MAGRQLGGECRSCGHVPFASAGGTSEGQASSTSCRGKWCRKPATRQGMQLDRRAAMGTANRALRHCLPTRLGLKNFEPRKQGLFSQAKRQKVAMGPSLRKVEGSLGNRDGASVVVANEVDEGEKKLLVVYSLMHVNLVVHPESDLLEYRSLLISTSHVLIDLKVVAWMQPSSIPKWLGWKSASELCKGSFIAV